jgi:hypothetical protein
VLAWIATSVISLARFADAEINGGPFLFFARELISEVGACTVVFIGNSAYARGQITFATLIALAILTVWASHRIAGKTP